MLICEYRENVVLIRGNLLALKQEQTELLSKEHRFESLARRAVTAYSDSGRSLQETAEDPVSALACQRDVLKKFLCLAKTSGSSRVGGNLASDYKGAKALFCWVLGSELGNGDGWHSGSKLCPD